MVTRMVAMQQGAVRFVRGLVTALIVLALLALLLAIVWHAVRERYVLPAIGNHLAARVERTTGWRMSYRSISGNVFTELDLYGVQLQPTKLPSWAAIDPSAVAVTIGRVSASYRPLELLRGKIGRIQADRVRLKAADTDLEIAVTQAGDLLAVACAAQEIDLERLQALVRGSPRLRLEGRAIIGGEFLFKAYRPHLMQVRLKSDDFRVRWGALLDARAEAHLELNGPATNPSLTGNIRVRRGRWTGVASSRPLGQSLVMWEGPFQNITSRFPGALHIRLDGDNFWVHTNRLHAKLTIGLLAQKKEPAAAARLVGTFESSEGTYDVRNHRFVLREGIITFSGQTRDSTTLDAQVETRIKRYRIKAAVHGTARDSHLQLTSQPPLSQEDILALMVFGRRLSRLSREERQQLSQEDVGSQALDLLFLGHAERIAAKWLWVDEINVQVSPDVTTGVSEAPIESVEIGKYVIPDRLFGSYQIEPSRPDEPLKHTVGAEYELSDSVSVEATVRAAMNNVGSTTLPVGTSTQTTQPSRKLEPEEALIRFRWKF